MTGSFVLFLGCLLGSDLAPAPGPAPPIRLDARTFVPKEGVDPALRASLEHAPAPVLVQLGRPLESGERAEMLARGLSLLSPIRELGWFARAASPAAVEHPAIRAALPFAPGDRLSRELRTGAIPPEAVEPGGLLRLSIVTFRDVALSEALARLSRFDADARAEGPRHVSLAAPLERVPEIEADPVVMWIETGNRPMDLLNDVARVATRVDEAQNFVLGPVPSYDRSGRGVQIAVFDTGVDDAHLDFSGRIIRVRPPFGETVPWHGTHCAGIAAGSGLRSQPNGGSPYQWRGMAPEAGIAAYTLSTAATDYDEAINALGCDVTTNSWVQSVESRYDARAMDLDSYVRGDLGVAPGRPITIVFGAGNNGTFRQYGPLVGYYAVFTSAKNTISVGATNSNDDTLTSFSSMGPTFDGRMKPDVVAPGCSTIGGIYSTNWPGGAYRHACGTSMATPCAAGVVALVLKEYASTYGVDIDSEPMPPAAVKAVLAETARDLAGSISAVSPDTGAPVTYPLGPDFSTGFGLVDAKAAVDLVRERRLRTFSVPATGVVRTLAIEVPPGLETLKVTIAWDDEPGNPAEDNTVPKLVNDLDLTLFSPLSVTHLPYSLTPLPHEPYDGSLTGIDPIAPGDIRAASRLADHLNNLEQAVADRPVSGRWSIRVRGFDLASAQEFSVAANVPLPIFSLEAACPSAPDSNGRLLVDASFENRTNESRPIRVAVNFVDCDGTRHDDARVFLKTVGPNKNPVRSIRVAVPPALAAGCDLTMELEVEDVASGRVEALATCTFRK